MTKEFKGWKVCALAVHPKEKTKWFWKLELGKRVSLEDIMRVVYYRATEKGLMVTKVSVDLRE